MQPDTAQTGAATDLPRWESHDEPPLTRETLGQFAECQN